MRRLTPAVLAIALAPCSLFGQQLSTTLEARVFADFNYLETEREEAVRGFRSGAVAGHLAATLSDRVTFFGEVSVNPTDERFNVEVERATLGYDHADWLRLSGGRYHTPIIYWNTLFHHGQWLQTTISRPQMIRFGGVFLPVHFVGAMAEGRMAGGGGTTFSYSGGVGNGRAANPTRAGDAGDDNASRAYTAAASLSITGRTGVHLGGALYGDRITPGAEGAAPLDERIYSLHLVREREDPEILGEYTRVLHEADGADGVTSEAYYGQIAYRLPGVARPLKPYLRAERVRPGADDPLFDAFVIDYEGVIGGVRWDAGPLTAFKVEYRSERFGDEPRAGTLALSLSFTFAVRSDALAPAPPAEGHHGS